MTFKPRAIPDRSNLRLHEGEVVANMVGVDSEKQIVTVIIID